jgi:glycosyltransferase involved in cell wall biosynthesis
MLVIIGDGPFLSELKSQAHRLGILSEVSFPGWLSPNELKSYYRRCSMVVVPSTWPEPFGMVGIEAMSYGKPVLAFDVGGISEWLKHEETGFLVKPKDAIGLAKRIAFLLERPELARKIGAKGRETVKSRFVPDAHVDQLSSVFHQAIDFFEQNPRLSSRAEIKR